MPDPAPIDNLPPHSPAPVPDDRRGSDDERRRHIVCEFCESRLTPHGHAMSLSEKARHFRDVDEKLNKANTRIADLETELRDAKRLAAEREPRKGIFG